MSPVDRAGPLTGTSFALSSYEKIQPGFRDEKRPKILGTSFGAKLEKQNKDGETQPSYYFCAYHCFGNPFSCITAVKRVANDVENSSGKENDAIQTALMRKRNYSLCDDLRCYVIDHLMHSLLRRIHPGNRDEVFIRQNFKPADFWDS